MSYDRQFEKTFVSPQTDVFAAAAACVKDMGGKVLKQDAEKGSMIAWMDKKLDGVYLGDRSKLEMKFSDQGEGGTTVQVLAYPLDPIGNKLMFGARKGVVETIVKVLFERMGKRLGG